MKQEPSKRATGSVWGGWRNPRIGPDGIRWSLRPGVSLWPRPIAATIARGRRQLRAGALPGGTTPQHTYIYTHTQTNTHTCTHAYTRAFTSAPLAESAPGSGLPRLPEQRPGRPMHPAPCGEPCPPSCAGLPGWGLGRQCARRVHGAGGLRAGLCRRSEALAAAPPSSFTFSALTHRPPTRG